MARLHKWIVWENGVRLKACILQAATVRNVIFCWLEEEGAPNTVGFISQQTGYERKLIHHHYGSHYISDLQRVLKVHGPLAMFIRQPHNIKAKWCNNLKMCTPKGKSRMPVSYQEVQLLTLIVYVNFPQ